MSHESIILDVPNMVFIFTVYNLVCQILGLIFDHWFHYFVTSKELASKMLSELAKHLKVTRGKIETISWFLYWYLCVVVQKFVGRCSEEKIFEMKNVSVYFKWLGQSAKQFKIPHCVYRVSTNKIFNFEYFLVLQDLF